MPDPILTIPLYGRPPGSGSTPKGVYHDPATSHRMAKQLLKAMRPMMKGKLRGKSKTKQPAHVKSVSPIHASKR